MKNCPAGAENASCVVFWVENSLRKMDFEALGLPEDAPLPMSSRTLKKSAGAGMQESKIRGGEGQTFCKVFPTGMPRGYIGQVI